MANLKEDPAANIICNRNKEEKTLGVLTDFKTWKYLLVLVLGLVILARPHGQCKDVTAVMVVYIINN